MSGRHRAVSPDRGGITRRLAATVLLCATLLSVVHPVAAPTEAAWTDAEFGSSSTFTAMTIPGPPITTCVANTGVLGAFNNFTIHFQLPAGYTAAQIQPGFGTTQASVTTMATPPAVAGPTGGLYTVTYTATLLGGLLGSLLGSTSYLGVRTVDPSGWTSTWRVVKAEVYLAGLGAACTVL